MSRRIKSAKPFLALCAVAALLGLAFLAWETSARGEAPLPATPGDGLDAAGLSDVAIAASVPFTWTYTFPHVYLPVIHRNWTPRPVLNDPSNPDGDGTYTVSWSAATKALSYVLEEAVRADFAGAVVVYNGTGLSYPVSGRGPTRYYYRVKAHHTWGDSAWSATQDVDVLWEMEPNNEALTEANGAILSGLTYYGILPDVTDYKDYFYFDLPAAKSVELWLTNIAAGNNYELVLRDGSLSIVAQSTNPGNADEHILTGVIPAARYYIQVVRVNGPGSSQAYHLRTVY